MSVLIDTNVAIFLADDREEVKRRIGMLDDTPVISLITLVELEGGVYADHDLFLQRRRHLDELLVWARVMPCDRAVVRAYANIVASLGFARSRLLDRLIAATAIVHDLTLITTNGPDFANIPGLRLDIWPRPTQ